MKNPDQKEKGDLVDESSLAGYWEHHDRPPAFEGVDGYPYTVSIEVDKVGNLAAPFIGYLVFPRWAQTGAGIVGHWQSPVLCEGRSREDVEAQVGRLHLRAVKNILDEQISQADLSPSGLDA